MSKSVSRYITQINIFPLFGSLKTLKTIKEAIDFLNTTEFVIKETDNLIRFEIKIIYNNNDKIEAQFSNIENATDFLRNYELPTLEIEK